MLAAAGHLGEFAEAIKSVAVMASAKLQDIDFSFLGVNLAAIPSFRFSAARRLERDLGLFLIPVFSGVFQMLSMFISQKMNNQVATNADGALDQNAAHMANQTNASMMIMMPLMSLWIGFSMPAADPDLLDRAGRVRNRSGRDPHQNTTAKSMTQKTLSARKRLRFAVPKRRKRSVSASFAAS